jgi:hypothetical protein
MDIECNNMRICDVETPTHCVVAWPGEKKGEQKRDRLET